jgi:hypothetical protein
MEMGSGQRLRISIWDSSKVLVEVKTGIKGIGMVS